MLKIPALTLLLVTFTLASQYAVIAPETAIVDSAFTVKWTAPSGHSKYDYLTLYSGDYNGDYLYNLNSLTTTYLYSSASSGSTSFTFSDPDARYIVAYYSSTNSTAVAVSDIIEASTEGYGISVFEASVYVPFNVEWTAKSPIGSDLEIVLYMVNSDTTLSQINFDSLTRGQSSGSSVFEVEQPGQYAVYLYAYYQTYQLASYYFYVSATGFELKVPSSGSIFEEFGIDWVAPANHNIYDNINVWIRNDDGTVTQGTSVSVNEAGASSGTAYLEVSTPGTYYATYALSSGKIVATSDNFKVDVSGFRLSVPATVSVQAPFALTWYAPEDHYEYDSIYLYYVSEDKVLYWVDSEYVSGVDKTSGALNFTVDHPGTFVAKYLSSSSVFAQITFNATVDLYNIVVPDVAFIGQNLSVSWQAPELHSSADQIVIYFMDGQTGTTMVNSQMIPYGESAGVIDFVLYAPGEYFVAYLMYSQYFPYPYTQVIDLEYVYAAVSVYTVSAPAYVTVNTPFYVNWTAPYAHNPSDQLSLAFFHPDLNAFTTVDTEYLATTSTNGVTSFTATTAGEYAVFYTIQPSLDAIAASNTLIASN